MTRTHSFLAPVAAALLIGTALPAFAADTSQELSTAAAHAGMAAGSPDLKMVHAHLQHVINCLSGPGGSGYDATQANPCKNQGAGAIPDSTGDKKKQLEAALAAAQKGLKETDVAKAKETATSVQEALNKAEM